MLQKWKTILTNWINCYFNEHESKERCITIDSVLNIISHLRENLSLDESKSSILEAHTIEEFIREKYPEFRFNNGGLEADTEEELYMVASLLLLFVCVNSKDIDIKNAMCSKLSIEDQEVILKFSKCLMECSPIKYIDVQIAINEACGQETVVTEPEKAHGTASETPPALRSLHGEVRRLQAALDAERFDRNYLQEELSRTNLKLEKLLKDKEQNKTDIVNLKAKISMCCGQVLDTKSSDMVTEGTKKLMKQLEQMEEKLVETQGQLDDVQYERDTYRTKVNELKQERDKLVSLHQQETTKNTQLSEDLENERRSVISLRELLTELRQHQQLNRLDSSLFECDDPDASIHSLQHNSSTCSEACANVVEVQLGEERAKIVVLKQQIQSLQEQLYELSRKTETERLSLEKIVSEKDNDIFNLKHRINKEIEIKNNMTVHYSDEVSKLNNDINELEQKLKDKNVQSTLVIETKMKDIQTLQEEKMSLLQSFHDETTKLENIIKNVKTELDNERISKSKMKEEYEHQMMKMKEKVLNRNNELVELQNNVLKSSEEIEQLHLELRQEKQAKDEVIQQCHNELELVNTKRLEAENDLRQKHNEIESLKERLNSNHVYIDQLNAELEYIKGSISQLTETCNILEQNKTSLLDEIGIRDSKIEEQQKEVDNWRNKVSEERESYKKHRDEYEMRIAILTKSIDDSRDVIKNLEETIKQDKNQTDYDKFNLVNKCSLLEENQIKAEQELEDRKYEIKSLEEEINTLKVNVEKHEENIKGKDNCIRDKDEAIATIKQELAEAKTNVLKSSEEIEQLRLEFRQEKQAKDTIKLELAEAKTNVLKSSEEIEQLHLELRQEKQAKDTIKQELAEAKTNVLKSSEEIEQFHLELRQEKQAKDIIKQELAEAKTNVLKSSEEIEQLHLELRQEKQAKDTIKQELAEAKTNVLKSSEEIEQLHLELRQEKQAKDNIKQELVEAKTNVLKSSEEIEQLHLELKQEKQAKDTIKQELAEAKTNVLKSSEEIEQLHLELRQEKQAKDTIKQELAEAKTNVLKSSEEIEQLQLVFRQEKQEKDTIKQELAEAKTNVLKSSEEIEELHIELKQEKQAKDTIEQELAEAKTNVLKSSKEIEQLHIELRQEKQAKDNIKQELAKAKTNVLKSSAEIEELYIELKQEKQAKDTIKQELAEAKTNVLKSSEEIEQLHLELRQEKQAKDTIKQELAEAKTNMLKSSKEIEQLHLEWGQEKQAKDEVIQQCHNELELVNTRRLEVENDLGQKHNEIESLKERLNSNHVYIDQLNAELEYLKGSISQLTETCNILEQNKTSLVDEIGIRDSKIEEQQKEVDNWRNKVSEERESYKKHRDEYEMRIAILTKSIDDSRDVIQNLEETIKQVKNQTDFDKVNLVNKCSLLQEYQIKAEKQLEGREKGIKSLEDEIKTLKEDVKKHEENMKGKDNCIRDKDVAIATIKQELVEAKTNVLKSSEEIEQLHLELRQEKQAKDTIKQELAEAKTNVLKSSEEIEQLHLELRQEKQAKDTIKQELAEAKTNVFKSSEEIEQFHLEMRQEKQAKDIIKQELAEAKTNVLKSSEEIEELHIELKQEKQAKDTIEQELAEAKTNVLKSSEEIEQLHLELRQEKQAKDNIKQELAEAKINVLKSSEEIEQLQIELKQEKQAKDTIKQELAEAKTNVLKSSEEIEQLHLECRQEKQAKDTIKQELAEAKTNVLKSSEEIEQLHLELRQEKQAKDTIKQELAEVKTNLLKSSEEIEQLHIEFRQEKQAKDEVIQQCHNELELVNTRRLEAEDGLRQKYNEIESLKERLNSYHVNIDQLNEELEYLKGSISQLTETCNILEGNKTSLVDEIRIRDSKIEEQQKEVDNWRNKVSEERESYKKQMDEYEMRITILTKSIDDSRDVIQNLEETIKQGINQTDFDKLNLVNKCSLLQEYQIKAEKQLEDREKEIKSLEEEIKTLKVNVEKHEENIKGKDNCIRDKEEAIATVKQELAEAKTAKEHLQIVLDTKEAVLCELKQKLDNVNSEEVMKALRNEEWVKAGLKEMHAAPGSERTHSHKYSGPHEKDYRDFHHQVDNTTSDLTHSSMESIKTISDLEKIIHDKNRTITTLQSDITYLKSLIADSENKLLDVSKELELSNENCQQLSSQLKKIVHQKNEEIAELKKQVTKMSVTENRASQIIKVSAKYQAIILKRIAEIKTNTVLKELTNFGNSTNGDNELRRGLNAGTITMEDLENFLETTDKHLRRCSEKQIALQKERDRLTEVNRINESEIINLKKFLTELSVSFKTFNNIKELYTHKLSRVVSVQRTVRREILSLDGRINDATMCKLERGYAAVMQDLSEAVMNLERWVERSISRTISAEKIKQAFMSDEERTSLASTTFQNAGLEVQLGELENSFQKLLEEVVRAQKGEGAKDAQAVTVMEVRAEYEDKLNRMKAKMKQLYQEQINVYKEKQKEEIASLERELLKAREKLAETSKAYDEHIRALTTELWRVGEKFLTKKEEVDWLRKKQVSGSLMSLQHVHSSGLVAPQEASRVSDAHSLRSLPVNNTNKREGRGLHMSDEEGEVFDNRWLQQLAATPRRSPQQRSPGPRLSELRWRNSLCPPHLKSSYPAETQFAQTLDEDDIKCTGAPSLGGRNQRKEVGITAYKKPGPPTPSKQAGRLSATDSELRESLRFEPEPQVSRKTSTPSRLRSLFRSNKNDTAEGTPRSKRLSIFRKK